VFYQATVRGLVEKAESGYGKVQTDLTVMRQQLRARAGSDRAPSACRAIRWRSWYCYFGTILPSMFQGVYLMEEGLRVGPRVCVMTANRSRPPRSS
jgi:hypothetical protein